MLDFLLRSLGILLSTLFDTGSLIPLLEGTASIVTFNSAARCFRRFASAAAAKRSLRASSDSASHRRRIASAFFPLYLSTRLSIPLVEGTASFVKTVLEHIHLCKTCLNLTNCHRQSAKSAAAHHSVIPVFPLDASWKRQTATSKHPLPQWRTDGGKGGCFNPPLKPS